MYFETAVEAIEWYCHQRVTMGEIGSTTEACLRILKGERVDNVSLDLDSHFMDDTVNAVIDLERILMTFKKLHRSVLIAWGIGGPDHAFEILLKLNPLREKKPRDTNWTFLSNRLRELKRKLIKADYIIKKS